MTDYQPRSTWASKFGNAFRGVGLGIVGQRSFTVHLFVGAAVLVVGLWLQLDLIGWSLITLCIGLVISAELFNSSLERLSKAVDRSENAELGAALDIASGAVLITSIAAAVVGLIVLGPPLWTVLSS